MANSNFFISQLADELFISERQLRRRLKQLTGLSPSQYFQEIRMNEGRRLLETETYRTVTEVSNAVGVKNSSTFTRNFIKRFGKKPSGYLYR